MMHTTSTHQLHRWHSKLQEAFNLGNRQKLYTMWRAYTSQLNELLTLFVHCLDC